jgi:hypothetical protein
MFLCWIERFLFIDKGFYLVILEFWNIEEKILDRVKCVC